MNTIQPTRADAVPIELMSISGAFVHAGLTAAHGDGPAKQLMVVAKTITAEAAIFFMCPTPFGEL
jgi:hypothetical protein